MHGSLQTLAPPPEKIVALRISRIDILTRLIVFARSALAAVLRQDLKAWFRIGRWMRIALSLRDHIADGALDAPREPRKARVTAGEGESDDERLEQLFDRERFFERDHAAERQAQACLDLPFGEVVALICKGIGMTPDWQAWASEPWAQEEIATQPPGSPYAGYANDAGDPPESPPSPEPPPEPIPSAASDVARLAAPPGLPAPPNRKARRAQARRALQRPARRRAS